MNQKILLYTSPAIGGVLQYNHSILGALATLGYEVTYVQEVPPDLIEHLGESGVAKLRQRAAVFVDEQRQRGIHNQIWLEPGSLEDARRIFAETQPDLIIFSNGAPIANFPPKRLAMEQHIPFIVVESLVHPTKPPDAWAPGITEMASHYASARAVIAVSQDNLNLLQKYFNLPPDKGQVIHYGRPDRYFAPIDPQMRDRLRQSVGIPLDAILCFTAARLDVIKGYHYQIGAIKQLKQTPVWDRLYFAWAGSGSMEDQLRQSIRQAKVDDRVKFLGDLPDISGWLDASDLFVLSSESEGMPLAIMEAMAKGLPVVATAISGIPEELGDTGKLLPSPLMDPQGVIRELAATIQTWADDENLRRTLGQACKQRADRMFREDRMVGETIAVIQAAIGSC